jgi:hypothetical protein
MMMFAQRKLALNEIITGSRYKASMCFCSLGSAQFGGVTDFDAGSIDVGGVNVFGIGSIGVGGIDCGFGFGKTVEGCGTGLINGNLG